jgi:hypothetical protein
MATGIFGPETVGGFLAAAEARFREGIVLLSHGCRAGAVYVFGYCAEMTVKAAGARYFLGYGPADVFVHPRDLDNIKADARALGVTIRNGHDAPGFAQWLVKRRRANGSPYDPSFEGDFLANVDAAHALWSTEMRYHDFEGAVPERDAQEVFRAVRWLMSNHPRM